MTRTQYLRMCSFATRMVRIQPPRHRKACREHVAEILGHMNCAGFSLHYTQVIDWDHSVRWTAEEVAEKPPRRHYSKNRVMSDWVSHEYGEYDRSLTRQTPDSEGGYGTMLRNCVVCCIRAALGVAVVPSGGVLGYTLGDLRQMWAPRPLPKWVLGFLKHPRRVTKLPDDTPVWL